MRSVGSEAVKLSIASNPQWYLIPWICMYLFILFLIRVHYDAMQLNKFEYIKQLGRSHIDFEIEISLPFQSLMEYSLFKFTDRSRRRPEGSSISRYYLKVGEGEDQCQSLGMTRPGIEPTTLRTGGEHSTTRPPRRLNGGMYSSTILRWYFRSRA